jgi:hypothetical protein
MRVHSALVLPIAAAWCLGAPAAIAGGPAYDLTGTWRYSALDVQQSFCDGSSSQEPVTGIVLITQAGEFITLTFPDPPESQVLEGRTSSFFLAAELNTADQATILSGTVAASANRINGSLLFFDRHPCPDAETGSARFVLTRLN